MSRIPTPANGPKTPSISRSKDAATAEHAELLALTWRKLEAVARRLFSMKEERAKEQQHLAEERYRSRAEYASRWALTKAAEYENEVGPALKDLGNAVATISKKKIVPPDPASFLPEVIDPELEAPIHEEKGPWNNRRREQIGFIDIACDIRQAKELSLSEKLPWCLEKEEPSHHDSLLRRAMNQRENRLTLPTIRQSQPTPPEWSMSHLTSSVWIDVRVSVTPIGQLLRELKTLREIAPSGTLVMVVVENMPPETINMLLHEGFIAITKEFLEALP